MWQEPCQKSWAFGSKLLGPNLSSTAYELVTSGQLLSFPQLLLFPL